MTLQLIALLALPAAIAPQSYSWPNETQIEAADGELGDEFGCSVSASGDTLAVGAQHAGDFGRAYVYTRDAGGWSLETELEAPVANLPIRFGGSVSVDGDTLVVGARRDSATLDRGGAAYVWERVGGLWTGPQKLVPLDLEEDDAFGYSVAVDGDTLVVGSRLDDDLGHRSGSAYVFTRVGGGWVEDVKLLASDGSSKDRFGSAVDVSGSSILVGASHTDHSGKVEVGTAYVFTLVGGAWEEEARLVATNLYGNKERFGSAVALDGDTAVVGAPGLYGMEGDAYVFERQEGSWLSAFFVPGNYNQQRGSGVAVEGARVVIGSEGLNSGRAHVFQRAAAGWFETLEVVPVPGSSPSRFGASVSLSGDDVVIGAPSSQSTSASAPFPNGAYRVYSSMLNAVGTSYCTAGASASGCQALISASGTPSATASSGFFLSVRDVEGAKDGLFFYGTNGKQANPWGSGTSFVCVVPPRVRGGLLTAFGSQPGTCDGIFDQDLNARWCATCPSPAHNPGAGAVMQAQLWYRDPLNSSNQTSSLSDAIEFTVAP